MAEASTMHEGVMGTTEGEQWRTSRQSKWKAACKSRVCGHAHIPWKWGIFNTASRTACLILSRQRSTSGSGFLKDVRLASASQKGKNQCPVAGASLAQCGALRISVYVRYIEAKTGLFTLWETGVRLPSPPIFKGTPNAPQCSIGIGSMHARSGSASTALVSFHLNPFNPALLGRKNLQDTKI